MKVAVVGVGHLGRHHARILAELEGVELAAVVDVDPERARQIGAQYGAAAFSDWRALPEDIDAVTIAAPTAVHAAIGVELLARGMHVLVEKPMAASAEEADALLERASRDGLVLAVGHTERFNPAVAFVKPHIRDPRFVEVHRLGTFSDRSLDIDVVFDLMIHDLDLVLDIVHDEVASIEAVGVPVLTPRVDIANVRLRFARGCIANLTASRISRERVRKIRFFERDAYYSVDYAAQEVESYRLEPQPSGMPAIRGGRVVMPHEEPLKRELQDFIDAIRQRRPPLVTGAQGRAALALAERVARSMEMTR